MTALRIEQFARMVGQADRGVNIALMRAKARVPLPIIDARSVGE